MKRELKFKVYYKNKQHIESGWHSDLYMVDGIIGLDNNDDWIYCQYTGLKDKNGREIYEGDVVRVQTYYRLGEFSYREVKWESNGGWSIFNVTEPLMEVIGNIYEKIIELNKL